MAPSPGTRVARTEEELRQRQASGDLRVRTAADFRAAVNSEGLEAAYATTDVVVASNAELTDQASLLLHLGPSDPPIRIRRFQLGGAEGIGGHGNSDLVLPLGNGGAQVLTDLLAGRSLGLSASGDASAQQPRRDLETQLNLERIGAGRLLLHRAIGENGVVAVSSREGITPTPWGPVLGPFGTALFSCAGAGSIGLTMPGLALLGPGSPVLVGGAIGWVTGAGSGHNPHPRRQASGHATSPGACCAVEVDLHQLQPQWVRSTALEGASSGLLVAIAAPVPLINLAVAHQAAADDADLAAPLLDFAIPRRVKPSHGLTTYAQLKAGVLELEGRSLRSAPAHSPRLAAAIALELAEQLRSGSFPIRLPLQPLSQRAALLPLEA